MPRLGAALLAVAVAAAVRFGGLRASRRSTCLLSFARSRSWGWLCVPWAPVQGGADRQRTVACLVGRALASLIPSVLSCTWGGMVSKHPLRHRRALPGEPSLRYGRGANIFLFSFLVPRRDVQVTFVSHHSLLPPHSIGGLQGTMFPSLVGGSTGTLSSSHGCALRGVRGAATAFSARLRLVIILVSPVW